MTEESKMKIDGVKQVELDDLIICLRLSSWTPYQAKIILMGLAPIELGERWPDRHGFLPGDLSLRREHSDDSYRGHFDIDFAHISSFVDRIETNLRPYEWVQLAVDNNYEPPWLCLVKDNQKLFELLEESREPNVSLKPTFKLRNVRRMAALMSHENTPPTNVKKYMVVAWLSDPPRSDHEVKIFRDWAIETFVKARVPMCALKNVQNVMTQLRHLMRNEICKPWVYKYANQAHEIEIPIDVVFPVFPRNAQGTI